MVDTLSGLSAQIYVGTTLDLTSLIVIKGDSHDKLNICKNKLSILKRYKCLQKKWKNVLIITKNGRVSKICATITSSNNLLNHHDEYAMLP